MSSSTLPKVRDRIAALLDDAVREVSDPRVRLSAVIHKAIRIARLRGDWQSEWSLEHEMLSLKSSELHQVRSELLGRRPSTPSPTQEYLRHSAEQYIARRSAPTVESDGTLGKVSVCSHSVPELEMHCAQIERDAERATPKLRVVVDNLRTSQNIILLRIREHVRRMLGDAEHALFFGQTSRDIFERTQRFVDAQLAIVAPEVLDQFAAAYRRASEGDVEARSHALTSCRRILKSVADRVYPAGAPVRDAAGKEHPMTDDKFLNRLRQYVTEASGRSASGQLLVTQIDDLDNRLRRLNDIASKGVHTDVSLAEVDQCVIHTYLAIGDVLRIASTTVGT